MMQFLEKIKKAQLESFCVAIRQQYESNKKGVSK
tara:strand:- start:491 stop:592 length:102 start_codon:yes stop_codon:yes gene_type:complete